jgi:diguanylate cyclase (GGDEF)-like protein/PAS domain S-box-containing protein
MMVGPTELAFLPRIMKGLRFKFVIATSAVLVLTLVSTALYLYQLQQNQLIQGLNDKTRSLGQFIALISPKSIYAFDITALDHFVEQITNDSDVYFAMITNTEGVPMTTVAPAGMTVQDMVNRSQSVDNNKHLTRYRFPIEDLGQKLGELIIVEDNTRLIQLNNANLYRLLAIDLLIILFLDGIIFIVFHLNVLRPVNHLIEGSGLVGEGKLDHQVPVISNDELGQLAICFNQMTQEIYNEQVKLKQANKHLANEIENRKNAENQMKLAASVFTYAREGIVITDPHGNIIDINDAYTQITGYQREEVLGKNPRFMQSGKHDDIFYRQLWINLKKNGYWSGEIWNKRKNGDLVAELLTISAVKDSNGQIQHFVALFSDITSQKEHQQQLERIAHYDSLTGLPNRMLLADRLQQAIIQTNRRRQAITVAYLDLDGFKEINDQYGHDFGDQLLINISQRMTECIRTTDTIARLGGDEFVAVLIDTDASESKVLLDRLLSAASQPVKLDDALVQVSASIGVTMYPQMDEVDADQLVRQADQAMYRAKLQGKNQFYLFDPAEDQNLRGHHEKIERLRQALENGELVLYYQPKVNLRTGEVIGVEALIRWHHPQNGVLAPSFFLPLIEQHPFSVALGEWVINSALKQIQQWRKDDFNVSISINIGAYQIQKDDFIQRLDDILKKYSSQDVQRLQMEVLETSTIDIAHVAQVMNQCRKLGIDFALDDFGTGYSSLTYLKHLPATVLKIDRSFIRDMMEDASDLAIVEGIIGLAKAFRREVVAEGIETMEHAEMLLMLGCDLAQGFAIAHPMPAENLPDWSKNWTPPEAWRHIQHIHSSDPKLLVAMVEHRSWVCHVQNVIKGKQTHSPEMDVRKCRFGYWLHNEASKIYGEYDEFKTIQSLHVEMHILAKHLIKLCKRNNHKKAEEELPLLLSTHQQLISEIKKLLQIAQTISG